MDPTITLTKVILSVMCFSIDLPICFEEKHLVLHV
jgi:hypothetical protein